MNIGAIGYQTGSRDDIGEAERKRQEQSAIGYSDEAAESYTNDSDGTVNNNSYRSNIEQKEGKMNSKEIAGMSFEALQEQESFVYGKSVANETALDFTKNYVASSNEFEKDKLALEFTQKALSCRGMCFYSQNKLVCENCIRRDTLRDLSLFYFE